VTLFPYTTLFRSIAMSNEGAQMLGEKFQSPLRATFRSLAKRNHYPQTLAESMVTAGMVVYKVSLPDTVLYLDSLQWADFPKEKKLQVAERKTVVAAGQLLTMDDAEAHDLGFSRFSVSSLDDALAGLHISNYETVRMGQTWSEGFVRIIETFAPILMLIGFGALYLEFKSPGTMIFAVIGVLCLALVFFGQYLAGMANYTELLIIIAGVVLVGIEIFVTPGMFMLGITGLLCIAVGILLSLQGFVIPNPSMPWQASLLVKNIIEVLASMILALGLSVSLVRFVFPRLGIMTHGPYLMDSLKNVHAESEDAKSVSTGDAGVALTLLRPAGKATIGGAQHDVVTLGDFIEKGSEIVVVDISQNRILVRRKNS
jgi:membrane-bound serine protease (ClpP class)